jgi:hypothetical protein
MYSDAQVLREAEEGEDAELPSDWPGPSRQQPGANSGGISYQVSVLRRRGEPPSSSVS